MAESIALQEVGSSANAVLMAFPSGLTIDEFMQEYNTLLGHPLPFRKLGFSSPVELLESVPGFVNVTTLMNRRVLLKAVARKENAHVFRMVKGQKKTKKKSCATIKRVIHHSLNLGRYTQQASERPADFKPPRRANPRDGNTLSPTSVTEGFTEGAARNAAFYGNPDTTTEEYEKSFDENSDSETVTEDVEGSGGPPEHPIPTRKDVFCWGNELSFQQLPEGFDQQEFFFIEVAEIFDPRNFWWYLYDQKENIEKLSDDMKNFYEDSENPGFELERSEVYIRQLVAAKYSADQLWYRGKVVSFSTNSRINVRFIDYGTLDAVSLSDVRHLHVKFMKLPRQARRGKLHNVMPVGSEKWSSAASQLFRSLVFNKAIAASVISKSGRERDEEIRYELFLVDTSDPEVEVFLSDKLAEEKMANLVVVIGDECNDTVRATSELHVPAEGETYPEEDDIDKMLVAGSLQNKPVVETCDEQDVYHYDSRAGNGQASTLTSRGTSQSASSQWSQESEGRGQGHRPMSEFRFPLVSLPPPPHVYPGAVQLMQNSPSPQLLMNQVSPLISSAARGGILFPPLQLEVFRNQQFFAPPPQLHSPYPLAMIPLPQILSGHAVTIENVKKDCPVEMKRLEPTLSPSPTIPFPDLLVHLGLSSTKWRPISSPCKSSRSPESSRGTPLPQKMSSAGNRSPAMVKRINLRRGGNFHVFVVSSVAYVSSDEIQDLCRKFCSTGEMELVLQWRHVAWNDTFTRAELPELFYELAELNVPWFRNCDRLPREALSAYSVDYALAILRIFGAKDPSAVPLLQGELKSFPAA